VHDRSIRVAIIAATLLVWAARVEAQSPVDAAVVARATGPVEVQRQSQPPWTPATVGMRLVERDDIRTLAGGLAELRLADGSILVLSENSRLVVTRLHFDPRTRAREASFFHLAVGKVRSVVATTALTLARTRQSTFAISTPAAVAAARSTVYVVYFVPPLKYLVASEKDEILCVAMGSFQIESVRSGSAAELVGGGACRRVALSPADLAAVLGLPNPSTLGHDALSGPVTVIDPSLIEGLFNAQASLKFGDLGFFSFQDTQRPTSLSPSKP